MLTIADDQAEAAFKAYEDMEVTCPTPRKIEGERVTHVSRALIPRENEFHYGHTILCDFGQARFGEYDPMIDIQPFQYRAPEVILGIPFDNKVDMWNLGVLVHFLILLKK